MSPDATGRAGGHPLAKETFPPVNRSLSLIRPFVEKWAGEVGLAEEPTYRLKLAVSEAFTNAIDHPKEKGDVTLWAWRDRDRFTVDVFHPGEFRVKGPQQRGHRGLGLPLMVASADEVSFASLPEGGTRVSLSVFLK
jgi:anti-sigma regulatory factor (Ser/Thr protein kinase)